MHEEAEGAEECEEEGADEEEEDGEEGDNVTHVEGAGVIDEGEENPEVLRQYDREHEDDEHALQEEWSDDEDEDEDHEDHDEHVPRDWQNYDFSQFSVNNGRTVSWEYRENEVCVTAIYPTTAYLKDAVKRWY